MRIKFFVILFISCFMLNSFASTDHRHYNKSSESKNIKNDANQVQWAGPCEIEIYNNTYNDIWVDGVFDDGAGLGTFVIPGCGLFSCDYPHYIDMYYYGYCHAGMNIYVETRYGRTLYAGYTQTGTTISIN